MKKPMLQKMTAIFLFLCTAVILLPLAVNADMGPKPSVRVRFENMGDELCYATLISQKPSTGPQSVWDGNEEHIYNRNLDLDIWRAFVEYEDADGFYFLQCAWQVNENKEFGWIYYPPGTFKILLYYPETDTFAVSGICKRYAFDTYYTVDMNGTEIGSADYNGELSNDDRLNAYRSYQWKQELVSLTVRIVLTILIEMAVALLFGFLEKRALLLLAGVNTLTQIVLNVILNLINYTSGQLAFALAYIALELAVFAMEAVLYALCMNRFVKKQRTKAFYILYALIANAVSFGAGILIARIMPGIF
ncbi:MAG: hypothetical protein IKM00_07270 [Clostridia bacterium]|nr:hypothetical protein [Clostridia bacterium]